MARSSKGSAFEREVCKRLGLWWGESDDLFWRATTSGARATTRRKAGRKTRGHYGDIAATCPEGEKLIDCITFELKRGYAASTFQDLLDQSAHHAEQVWEQWIRQAMDAWTQAGSYAWALIVKRDQRQELICIPQYFYRELRDQGVLTQEHRPGAMIRFPNRKRPDKPILVFITTLSYFLEEVEPCHIRQLHI